MPLADDLLEQCYHLAQKDTGTPMQASLRRALSTAYYALFHLLIEEAVNAWAVERQRSILARTFDHGRMRAICDGVLRTGKVGSAVPPQLMLVAQSFIVLQDIRHTADYDNARVWSRTDVLDVLDAARDAFDAWRAIRSDDAAQDFLLDLFLPKRAR